jgi:hypothetical protein
MEFEHKQQNVMPQKCPVCDAAQDALSLTPLRQDQERAVMHIACEKCGNAIIVFVMYNDVGTMTFGVLTDVYADEAHIVFGQSSVNYDDVLEVHHYLQNDHDVIQELDRAQHG